MKIKFWGVRGSIPCPGPQTVKYGGNTPCIEIRIKDTDRLLIIDAGSGIRELGNQLLSHDLSSKGSIQTEIFLTHTHWDHIMGFPFFTPIYIPDTRLKIYGPVTYEDETLEEVVGGQLSYRYFPVRQAELAAEISYIDLKEETIDLGDGIKVTTKYLNHPILCLGYRFEFNGKIVCTACDTEPFRNVFCTDPDDPSYDETMAMEGEEVAAEENRRIERFFAGADLLIHDTQYTEEEYRASKVGWGHTSFEHAIAAAKRAKVKRLALFHHEPLRTDRQIDELARKYCNPDYAGEVNVFFAREGMEIEI
ncbi:MAG: MBL fold metallo-hydrolase [Deltaproteobacteria bacterium]|nr:MBL fold metallo-hydrolase [Deltaproteobacteria bacterium]MBW2015333.1 MBL fold metallo-hydrolase [Deltaproteobacteria bacterium]MBW2128194.1 MBL fold metallo-hydrolase [Deltaproteobacteria bacterium]MBW2303089.1 MBL fold metallo-hydrolase [Deltaproteobacteria bacterium]